jgi:hypothetical protein
VANATALSGDMSETLKQLKMVLSN